jgi:hypothetical protein
VARKFITTRELGLIDSWNRELIQGTVQQEVIYYGISYEESSVHDVYDEAVTKEYLQPVRINARVEFDQGPTVASRGTIDSTFTAKVVLHAEECRQRNVNPREGDFVEYGQVVFEVTSVHHAQPVFGQINDKLKYELSCVASREGQFKVDSVRSDGIDNTHPVNPRLPRSLSDDIA